MINYKEESLMFDEFLKINNYSKKELSEKETNICNDLSKIIVIKPINIKFNYRNINKLFLESIKDLDNNTIDFYKKIIPNIKRHRSMHYKNGEAELVGNSKKQEVCITRKAFKDIDFIAYSHELGHVPSLKNGARLDYFEYSEILPIFFEYLSCLVLDKENADKLFLCNRLDISKEEAKEFKDINDINCFEDKYHYSYLDYLKRDRIKYIISLEYVLNLIEIYKNDKELIKSTIDSIVTGYSSFKEIESDLDIEANDYKKIKKILNSSN